MQAVWHGHYLDGQTAVRHPATIRILPRGLEVTTAGGWTRLWPYGEIRQTQGFYEGEEVRLQRGGEIPEMLLVSDVSFLLGLHEVAPQVAGRFHDPRLRGLRLRLTVLAAVGVVVLVAAAYLWGIPTLSSAVAARVPVAWEESLGEAVAGQLAPAERRCEDPRLREAVDSLVARLAGTAPEARYTYRVLVVNSPAVNALAAPGGYVVVFRGLLERTRTPEELAGVLAHELQHVLQRHATRALIQHASTGLLLAALTGDVTGPMAYGIEAARLLSQLSYSRQAEEEADAAALPMLLAARIDPGGLVAFFDGIEREEEKRGGRRPEVTRYLSTHPSPGDRVARLRRLAAGSAGVPERLLPGQAWNEIRQLCAAPRP